MVRRIARWERASTSICLARGFCSIIGSWRWSSGGGMGGVRLQRSGILASTLLVWCVAACSEDGSGTAGISEQDLVISFIEQ